MVERAEASLDDEAGDGVGASDLVHLRPGVHLAAELADADVERVDQRLVTALEPAHHLVAVGVARRRHPPGARPDVRRRQVVEASVELRVEQRLPQPLERAAPAPALEPREQRLVVEARVRAADLAARGEAAEADPVRERQERERQQLARRRHREQAPVVVEADLARAETEAVAEAELLREAARAVVAGQDHVVEAVDALAVEVERADEPAEVGCALVERHLHAAAREPVRGGHAEDAAADDAHRG